MCQLCRGSQKHFIEQVVSYFESFSGSKVVLNRLKFPEGNG